MKTKRRTKAKHEPTANADTDEIDDTVEDFAGGAVRTRVKILAIEGEGSAVLEALRVFVQNGHAAQSAIDELGAGRVEGAVVVSPAPKRVPLQEGGKPLGMERPKQPRRNRSI